MLLISNDGASVELQLLGYQFPQRRKRSRLIADTDANWLLVAGEAQTNDGRGWGFTEPCLMTFEARQLRHWLTRVAKKKVGAVTDNALQEQSLLTFTEPNLGFSVAGYNDDEVTLRFHASIESLPPWERENDWETWQWFIHLQMKLDDVEQQAHTWKEEAQAFPQRR